MDAKSRSLALALAKPEREAPKLSTWIYEDETTRPLSLQVIALLAAENDSTVLMRLPLTTVAEAPGLQIGDEDEEEDEE